MEIYYIYKISESYIKNIIVLDCCTHKKSNKYKYKKSSLKYIKMEMWTENIFTVNNLWNPLAIYFSKKIHS